MTKILTGLIIALLVAAGAQAAGEGMIKLKSAHSVAVTADRLENVLKSSGMTVLKRIDHAAGAASVGRQFRPTELLIFGNPRVGTPLMQCSPSIAIDLPQKALIWQDRRGQVWLGYNDPKFLALRHDISGCDELLEQVANALAGFAAAAVAAE